MLNNPTICTCSNRPHEGVYKRQERFDPTKTTSLRRSFVVAMRKRVKSLCTAIIKKVVEDDCFGLMDQAFKITVMSGEFNFARSADKVTAFMDWLRQQEKLGLLAIGTANQVGQAVEGSWTDFYIADSYERGVQRARYELIKRGYDVPKLDSLATISATFSTPFHIDRVGLVFSRVYTELKGITDSMDKQVSTILSQGLVDGKGPRELARLMVRTITGPDGDLGITDSLGRYIPAARRAEMLARTEIIRAHHAATVQEYKNWGLEGVKVMAEWQTAGYNVCPQCSELQGKVFTLSQIETMIPAHPNCRCCAVPVDMTSKEKK